MVDCAVVIIAAAAELTEEEDMEEGSSTEDLAPKQAPAPWAAMPAVPKFWATGPSDDVVK